MIPPLPNNVLLPTTPLMAANTVHKAAVYQSFPRQNCMLQFESFWSLENLMVVHQRRPPCAACCRSPEEEGRRKLATTALTGKGKRPTIRTLR